MMIWDDPVTLSLLADAFNGDMQYVEDLLTNKANETKRLELVRMIDDATTGDKTFDDYFQIFSEKKPKLGREILYVLAKCLRLATTTEQCDKLAKIALDVKNRKMYDLIIIRVVQIRNRKLSKSA